MKKETYAKICPNCGSTNIGLFATDAGIWNFCKDCDFGRAVPVFGGSFPEIEISELERFRAKLKNHKLLK